jgi:hypothetical protein
MHDLPDQLDDTLRSIGESRYHGFGVLYSRGRVLSNICICVLVMVSTRAHIQ